MNNKNDILSETEIKKFLKKQYRNLHTKIFETIDSTNNYAKKIAGTVSGNKLIAANSQTAGRGRFERKFFSPADTGIYMSIILKKEIFLEDTFLLTFAAAIAVCKTIEKLTDTKPEIKWINDIFIKNRKVCGILTETSADLKTKLINHSITGIGLNINTADFPDEIAETATSLFCESSRNEIIAETINFFFDLTENMKKNQILEEYKKRSNTINRNICYTKDGTTKYAKAVDINEKGNLVIQDSSSGISVLEYGDIYLEGSAGYEILPQEF